MQYLYRDAEGLSPEVYDAIERVGQALEAAGAIVEEVTLPDYALFNACGRVILTAEAFAIHEKDLRERPEDYGELFLMRIVTGAAISSADYIQAQRLRRELSLAVNREALKTYDVLLTACALGPAPAFAMMLTGEPVGAGCGGASSKSAASLRVACASSVTSMPTATKVAPSSR